MSEFTSQASGLNAEDMAQRQRACEVFFGSASPAEARIYARVSIPVCAETGQGRGDGNQRVGSLELTGRLVGPQCDFANTLPARLPFRPYNHDDARDDHILLAEAIVPDPCFWTPELPFLYRAELEVRSGDKSVEQFLASLGICRFGVRGANLQLEGNRFVLRGGRTQMRSGESGMRDEEISFARETWTAAVVGRPNDDWCEVASRRGVLTVADLTDIIEPSVLDAELHRVARWPCVVIALLNKDASPAAKSLGAVRNLTLAQAVPANDSIVLANWARIAFVEVSDSRQFLQQNAKLSVPIVAVRSGLSYDSLSAARAACDQLQAELASHGDFAGYIVR